MNLKSVMVWGWIVMILGAVRPAEAVLLKRYNVESGVLTYELTGSEKGREVVIFDQWGMREVRQKTTFSPIWGQRRRVTYWTFETVTEVDWDKRIGQKRENRLYKGLVPLNTEAPVIQLEAALMAQLNGRKSGEKEILNKPCRFWTVEKTGVQVWEWEWIPFRTERKTAQGPHVRQIVKAELNVPVDSAVFAIPRGIHFLSPDQDMDAIVISRVSRDLDPLRRVSAFSLERIFPGFLLSLP